MANNYPSSRGVGFFGLLTIVFIILKLCHEIDWSWWLVLAPLIVSVSLSAVILIIVFIVGVMILKR